MNRRGIFILGALNGAAYSAVMYTLVSRLRAAAGIISYEWWPAIFVSWILLFAVVALLVNRFYPRNGSSVLFWEATGILAVSAWNILRMLTFSLEHGLFNSPVGYDWVRPSSNPLVGVYSLAVVVVVSFVYSLVLLLFTTRRA